MGTALQVCTGSGKEAAIRINAIKQEQEELQKKLIEQQNENALLHEQSKNDIMENFLRDQNKEIKQKLEGSEKERKRLHKEVQKRDKKLDTYKNAVDELRKENKSLKQQLAAVTTDDGNESSEAKSYASEQITDNHSHSGHWEQISEDKSPREDITKLRNWLVYKSLCANDLRIHLCQLLTCRNISHRIKIPEAYKQRYGTDLLVDIGKKIKKKNILELIAGMFQSRAQFEAYCIHEIIHKHKKDCVLDVTEIICCKTSNDLKLICDEYCTLYGSPLKDKIDKLSNGRVYLQIVENIFDFEKNDNATTSRVKIEAKIRGNVEFLMDKGIKWKKYENKLKLAMCVMSNDREYVHDLNALYFKQSDENLVDFVDKQFGKNSTAGSVIKTKIEQSIDYYDYFARKLQIDANDGYISRIFVMTFDNELMRIQKTFDDLNYGDNKTMIEWIKKTRKDEKYASFLITMLERCSGDENVHDLP